MQSSAINILALEFLQMKKGNGKIPIAHELQLVVQMFDDGNTVWIFFLLFYFSYFFRLVLTVINMKMVFIHRTVNLILSVVFA